MATWSGIRNKLENEYLAYSLRGHIQYFVTRYRTDMDNEGRAAIRYDGKEIIKGCYWNNWVKSDEFPKDDTYEKRRVLAKNIPIDIFNYSILSDNVEHLAESRQMERQNTFN